MNIKERSFQYYKYYIAMKLHFNSQDYDFFRNMGVRATPQSFLKRKDRYFFEKMASVFTTEKYLEKLLVAAKEKKNFYIRDVMTQENEKKYLQSKGYMEAFDRMLEKEVSDVVNYCLMNKVTRHELFEGEEEKKPVLFNLLRKNVVSYETFICLDKLYDVSDHLAKFSLDPLVTETTFFIDKYKPFCSKHIPKKEVLSKIIVNSIDLLS